MSTNLPYLGAGLYGMKPSNTGVQNQAALTAAVAAAWALGGRTVLIPAGTYLMNMHGNSGPCIALTQSTIIRGAGKSLTTLQADGFVEGAYTIGPPAVITTAHDNGAMLFKAAAGAGEIILSDMTLQGPAVGEITLDLNVCWALWSGSGNQVTIERVNTLLWNQISKCSPEFPAYPGAGTNFKAIDCVLGYRSGGRCTSRATMPRRIRPTSSGAPSSIMTAARRRSRLSLPATASTRASTSTAGSRCRATVAGSSRRGRAPGFRPRRRVGCTTAAATSWGRTMARSTPGA